MSTAAPSRFELQERAYAFPYHYIPRLEGGEAVAVARVFGWGLEYLTYMHWVRATAERLGSRTLLDVGCGDGRLLSLLRGTVPERTGVDPVEAAVRFAGAFNPDAEVVVGTAADVARTFDLVTCVETLEHIPDADLPPFVAALAERVAEGGALVVTVPSAARPVHPKHHRHYTRELLVEQLSRHFAAEEVCELFRLGPGTRLATRLLTNRLWTLNARAPRRWIWRWHRRSGFTAPPGTGAHVAGVFRRVR
jgi:SAM-dependent methyltransferase